MPKKQESAYGNYNSYQLTDDQLRRAVLAFEEAFYNDPGSDEMAGMMLALLRAFTYTTDNSTRENMLVIAEETLMPFVGAAHEALDRLAVSTHKALLKAGGVQ